MSWNTVSRTIVGTVKTITANLSGNQTASNGSNYTTPGYNVSGSIAGNITFVINSVSNATIQIRTSSDGVTYSSLPSKSYSSITDTGMTESVRWRGKYTYVQLRIVASGGDCVINTLILSAN